VRFTVAASAARVTAQHPPSNSVCVCVLQRPLETFQYTSIRFTETVALEGLTASRR